jgi:23S rRNA G2445 N2-methylase RlmL
MHRWDGHASRAELHFMVRALRGLETITRDEVCGLLDARDVRVEHRAVRFSLPWLDPRVLALGTVDDAFLVVGEVDGIGRPRRALGALASLARSVDLGAALVALGRSQARTFDVTASFIGRRNYSRFEIEERVACAVAAATGWSYRPRDGAISLRVHVLHERATLAVRLAPVPLHRRAYRVASRPGALHPPLARALAVVAAPARATWSWTRRAASAPSRSRPRCSSLVSSRSARTSTALPSRRLGRTRGGRECVCGSPPATPPGSRSAWARATA